MVSSVVCVVILDVNGRERCDSLNRGCTIFLLAKPPDPCKTVGCKAPYNIGCRVVNNTAECICPTCTDTPKPVCASDGVQDRSECHMKRQSCSSEDMLTVTKPAPCGM